MLWNEISVNVAGVEFWVRSKVDEKLEVGAQSNNLWEKSPKSVTVQENVLIWQKLVSDEQQCVADTYQTPPWTKQWTKLQWG